MAFTDTSRTCLDDQRGFTLHEVLIAASTFLFILFAVYLVYEASRNTFARGEAKTDIQQNARMALSTMERELRMAGYGVPALSCPPAASPLPRIVEARPRKIIFRADLRGVLTWLTVTTPVPTDTLNVNTTSGILVSDTIYLTDGATCAARTVQKGVSPTSFRINSPLAVSFASGSQVYRPKDITFTITGGQLLRDQVNPDAAPSASPPVLAQKVKEQEAFRYYDDTNVEITPNDPVANADLLRIRRITITLLTSDTPPGLDLQSYPVQSDVRPRNL